MFADLGHFSYAAIQIAFSFLVYPALILAYMGQAAFLSKHHQMASDTSYYVSVPEKVRWPVLVIAILASVVGGQAIISGTFSIINQSQSLGCFPRVKVVHTSEKKHGQIYIPEINWIFMVLCIVVTIGFRDTKHMGNASGFAFVYFEDERDAEDAINALDNTAFGYDRRRLSVEWARGERNRHRDGSKSVSNQRPTKTLFVINFDPVHTSVRDIEKHFEPYWKILHVRIQRNFAFVQFETQEEATKALECTHMSKVLDRVVSVEYALRDDGERGDRSRSPRRDYGRRGDSPIRRSLSPYRRGRPSPNYGRAHSRPSPDYGRSRPSPDYGRAHSPVYDTYNGPSSHERPQSPGYDRYRSRSPVRRSRS